LVTSFCQLQNHSTNPKYQPALTDAVVHVNSAVLPCLSPFGVHAAAQACRMVVPNLPKLVDRAWCAGSPKDTDDGTNHLPDVLHPLPDSVNRGATRDWH